MWTLFYFSILSKLTTTTTTTLMERIGKRERVHFGTLENDAVAYAKRKRQEEDEMAQAQKRAHIDLEAIDEVLDDGAEQAITDEALENRRKAMAEFERKRMAQGIAVPTDDMKVKEDLRKHGHPICLFGEDAGDRRNRLRYILSKLAMKGGGNKDRVDDDVSMADRQGEDSDDNEEFYTEGSAELLRARRDIAIYSLTHARKRISGQRQQYKALGNNDDVIRQRHQTLAKRLNSIAIGGSEVVDERPISRVVWSPNSKSLLTGSWSGSIKLWDVVPQCQSVRTFRGHTDRIGGLSFHPQKTIGTGETVDFASGSADNNIFLWSLNQETPIGKLLGHQNRVVHVQHHPNGKHLGSASYDGSWRLWDINSQQELLLQEGHSREVFALRFQCDGALVATGGLDGVGRVWDLRSGRSVATIEGHSKEIFGIDWSPNGYEVATGGADNTIRIFDLRKLDCTYQIPAHKSMVTDIRFFHSSSTDDNGTTFLASAGNDGLVNVWSAGDWKLRKSLAAHIGKVMSVDIARDGSYIASSGYDHTFKVWGPEDDEGH